MCEFNSFKRAKAYYKRKIVQGSNEKLTLTKMIAYTKTALLSNNIDFKRKTVAEINSV